MPNVDLMLIGVDRNCQYRQKSIIVAKIWLKLAKMTKLNPTDKKGKRTKKTKGSTDFFGGGFTKGRCQKKTLREGVKETTGPIQDPVPNYG